MRQTPSDTAVERAGAILGSQFPKHIPGHQDGWAILRRAGRPVVVWDLHEKIDVVTVQQAAKHRELVRALEDAGLAVTAPTNVYMAFFAEMPRDRTSPRYAVKKASELTSIGLYPVLDTWTGVYVTTAESPEQAARECARRNVPPAANHWHLALESHS